jgi:hypothetical protein
VDASAEAHVCRALAGLRHRVRKSDNTGNLCRRIVGEIDCFFRINSQFKHVRARRRESDCPYIAMQDSVRETLIGIAKFASLITPTCREKQESFSALHFSIEIPMNGR